MKLKGQQLATLHAALLDAYRSQDELSQMLRLQMDENLEAVVGSSSLNEMIFKLINWAEARGRVREFVEGALSENPGNVALQGWIEENREVLTKIDTSVAKGGGQPISGEAERLWWNQLPNVPQSIAGIDTGINKSVSNRDVIIANVGSGSKNVAVGKNITQIITEIIGEAQADDGALISSQIQKVVEALNSTDIDPRTAGKAEANIELLAEELGKASDDDPPAAKSIIRVGDWLLDNVPEITQAISELFGMPAVGRVLGRAGDAAIEWACKRFGR